MSRLEELIQEYCPDGVEYKELSEIFDTRNGYTPSKAKPELWQNGTVPWFRMEDIREKGNIRVGGADKILDYADRPSFCLYSSGLSPPRDILIRFSRYQTI